MGKSLPSCDMCGKQEMLLKALIEGVEMSVCKGCASFGKVLSSPSSFGRARGTMAAVKPRVPEVTEGIVEEYALIIKQAREKRKVTQEEFAKMLNVHESLLRNIEAGKQKPALDLARKLEKQLDIILVEKVTEEESDEKQTKTPKGPMTIGDMLLLKK
jgi:putative transcription factor